MASLGKDKGKVRQVLERNKEAFYPKKANLNRVANVSVVIKPGSKPV